MTAIEEWKVPNPGETRPRFRLIVSTYGLLNVGGTLASGTSIDVANSVTTDFRQAHESVSATRAFFDVR